MVQSVNVLTTVSTVLSRKGMRSPGRPRNSILSFVRRFCIVNMLSMSFRIHDRSSYTVITRTDTG